MQNPPNRTAAHRVDSSLAWRIVPSWPEAFSTLTSVNFLIHRHLLELPAVASGLRWHRCRKVGTGDPNMVADQFLVLE